MEPDLIKVVRSALFGSDKTEKEFFAKHCTRTKESFYFHSEQKSKQKQIKRAKELITSHYSKQGKTFLETGKNSDIFTVKRPERHFIPNSILSTHEGFMTDVNTNSAIDFKIDTAQDDYNDKVKTFCKEKNLAIRSGCFFSEDTYTPNIKVANLEDTRMTYNDYPIYNILDIEQAPKTSKETVGHTLKKQIIPAWAKGIFHRWSKTKKIKTGVGASETPILDFGFFDIGIILQSGNPTGEKKIKQMEFKDPKDIELMGILECWIAISLDFRRRVIVIMDKKELNSEAYLEDTKLTALEYHGKPSSVYSITPSKYEDILKVIETSYFVNIIGKSKRVTKVCDTQEYLEFYNLSTKYGDSFSTIFANKTVSTKPQKPKNIYKLFLYKSLPMVENTKSPKLTGDTDNVHFDLPHDEKVELIPMSNQDKYIKNNFLSEHHLAIRGHDENGKAIIYDQQHYIGLNRQCIFPVYEESVERLNIKPLRVFYIDTKCMMSIGVFDCIRTQTGEIIRIHKARVYLNKSIVNNMRDAKTSQLKKQIVFSWNSPISAVLQNPNAIAKGYLSSQPVSEPYTARNVAIASADIIPGFTIKGESIGTRFTDPLKDVTNCSILLLEEGGVVSSELATQFKDKPHDQVYYFEPKKITFDQMRGGDHIDLK